MSTLDSAVQTLVQRLETVTARLEAVEKQIASGAHASSSSSSSSSSASASGDASSSASVQEYENLINEYITPLVQSTEKIGSEELKSQVALVVKAVNNQKQFLATAASSKKPAQDALVKLIEPTSQLITQITKIRDDNRKSKQFNHLSAISEGIPALGWVVIEPTPAPFINESRASSEFYSNKILMEFKKSDQSQVDWVHHWNSFLKELATYVKKNHTTGTTWNPRGGEASSASAAAPAAKAGGPPPPPPAPTAPLADKPGKAAAPDAGNLFAEINKGGAITSGLKKVTKEMKNKYNPDKSSLVPADAIPAGKKAAPAKTTAVKKGTPKFELSGNKWIVEWQENNNNIEIKETELKQTIYIYKCENSVVKITGKVNSITIDSCKRVGVVFHDALALVELVNSNSIEVQCTGKVPSATIDKCSGVQFFVSKEGVDVEIVTSKSDAMNVLVPDPAGGVDPIELAVPEQFKTVIKNSKLITNTVEHV